MLPVRRARSISACAVRTPWWLWFTPMVHQNDTARLCSIVDVSRRQGPNIDHSSTTPVTAMRPVTLSAVIST